MLNRQEELDKIKRQLGTDTHDDDLTLLDLFDGWFATACGICNRPEDGKPPAALLAIVRDTVVAAYHRRGDEGLSGEGVGGQSYSYEKLYQAMLERLVHAGLRVYRL